MHVCIRRKYIRTRRLTPLANLQKSREKRGTSGFPRQGNQALCTQYAERELLVVSELLSRESRSGVKSEELAACGVSTVGVEAGCLLPAGMGGDNVMTMDEAVANNILGW